MLRFTSVRIQNFMSYRDVTLGLDGLGAVLVLGMNETSGSLSSNGSGKTALAEAIFWCLFGKTFRDVPAASVINNQIHSLEDCKVTLVCRDTSEFEIARVKGSPKAAAKAYVTDSNGMVHTNDAAERYIANRLHHLTPEQFSNLVFLGRDYRMKLFHEMSDGERKEFFETVCEDLSVLARMHERMKENRKAIEHELDTLRGVVALTTGRLSALKDRISDARANHAAATSALRKSLAKIDAKLEENTSARGSFTVVEEPRERHTESLDVEISDMRADLRRHEQQLSNSVDALNNLKRGVCPTCKRPWPDTATNEARAAEINDFIAKTKKVHEKLRLKLAAIVDKRSKIVDTYNRDTLAYKEYLKRVASIGSDDGLLAVRAHTAGRLKKLEAVADPATELVNEHLAVSKELHENERRIVEYENRLALLDTMLTVTADSGLKSYLLDELLADLEMEASRMSEYLSNGELEIHITSATKGDFRKREGSIVIRAYNQHGADLYAGNSSGERTRVDLCILFGLVMTIRNLYGVDIGFMFLDEVLDSLDDAGVESVVELIQKEIVPVKGTVLLTTHNDSLKSLFDRAILVKKVRGVSEVYDA